MAMAPMSRAQWEAESSKVRQVFDPATGRVRLVRGAGEIIEQIVSKAEQKRLRQLATTWDGQLGSGSLLSTRNIHARLRSLFRSFCDWLTPRLSLFTCFALVALLQAD